MRSGVRRIGVLVLLALATLLAPLATMVGVASAASDVGFTARLDGVDVAQSTERHPVRLDPDGQPTLELTVQNDGDAPAAIRTIRLEGRVIGLTFFAYDTSVALDIAPHSAETRSFVLDLVGLKGQATGLIPSRIVLLGPDRSTVATQELIADVRGSLKSVYGLFGLALVALTAISFTGALLALARTGLHPNRWRRALRFLTPGLGLGLVLIFTLSALRVLSPEWSRVLPSVVGSGLVFFVVGYLTPSPDHDDDDDDLPMTDSREPARATIRPQPAGSLGDNG